MRNGGIPFLPLSYGAHLAMGMEHKEWRNGGIAFLSTSKSTESNDKEHLSYIYMVHRTSHFVKTVRWTQKCRSITQESDEIEHLSYYIYKRGDSSPPDSFY